MAHIRADEDTVPASNGSAPSAAAEFEPGVSVASAAAVVPHSADAVAASVPVAIDGDASASSLRCSAPISVRFSGLTALLQERNWRGRVKAEHAIIKGISANFEPGKLIGIMGGSGSGKTTLLNLLANRGGVRQSCRCTGSILFNGRPGSQYGSEAAPATAESTSRYGAANTAESSSVDAQLGHNLALEQRIGYVLQQEFLLPHLTVHETLMYAAQLRLSRDLTLEEKRARVDEVIRELNLKAVRDSIIGDERVRGISGGEKRRVRKRKKSLHSRPLAC